MARNIALTITLNGVEQSVSSINELEAALRTAREELSTLEIGSEGFNKLSREISEADSQLKQLNNTAKGSQINKTLDNTLKAGRLIASSFGAATAALGLFGIESESLSKAQVKALQALTLTTTLADLATQRKTFTDLAATIQQRALTLSTTASTAAMRTFFAVIAANPMGALLTVIGLVVGALIALSSSTDEATDATEKFNNELERQKGILNDNIALLQAQGADELDVQQQRVKNAQQVLNLIEKELNARRAAGADKKEIDDLEQKRAKAAFELLLQTTTLETQVRKKAEQEEKDLEAARKDRDEERKRRLEEELRIRNELLKKTIEEKNSILSQVLDVKKLNAAEADVVKTLTERLKKTAELRKNLEQYRPIVDVLVDGFKNLNAAIPGDEALSSFKELFDTVEKGYELLNTPPTETTEEMTALYDELNRIANLGPLQAFINKEATENLVKAVGNVKDLFFVINQLQTQGFKVNTEVLFKEVLKLREILDDPFVNPDVELKTRERLKTIEKNFVLLYTNLRKKDQEYKDQLNNPEGLKSLEEGYAETARIYLTAGIEGLIQFNLLRDGVKKVNTEVNFLRAQIKFLSGVELRDFLLTNKEALTQAYQVDFDEIAKDRDRVEKLDNEVSQRTFDRGREFAGDLLMFREQLAKQGLDISRLTYEEQLVLLQTFLKAEVTEEEKAAQKRADARNKELDAFANGLREFQGILNSIQQSFTDYYNTQFDRLEQRNKTLQALIVGDTALANQKRIDLEKQYQAEKTKLEKQAAKTALRISLLQATSNVAESITAALRTGIPVVSQIAAGVNAAIGAVQVGIIANQLSNIDSLQRGGKVKMRSGRGGLLVGPSHENGGIRYAQRGIELEGGEAVINRMSTIQYGDLLNEINMAGGGRPIVNQNFDDSRLIEAIAKQRSQPIRAYVVEQDITDKQSLAKRLDQLSTI